MTTFQPEPSDHFLADCCRQVPDVFDALGIKRKTLAQGQTPSLPTAKKRLGIFATQQNGAGPTLWKCFSKVLSVDDKQ
jgi:hypothetical protein